MPRFRLGLCFVVFGLVCGLGGFSWLLSGYGRLLTRTRGRHIFFSLLETARFLLLACSPYFAFLWRSALGVLVGCFFVVGFGFLGGFADCAIDSL